MKLKNALALFLGILVGHFIYRGAQLLVPADKTSTAFPIARHSTAAPAQSPQSRSAIPPQSPLRSESPRLEKNRPSSTHGHETRSNTDANEYPLQSPSPRPSHTPPPRPPTARKLPRRLNRGLNTSPILLPGASICLPRASVRGSICAPIEILGFLVEKQLALENERGFGLGESKEQ